MILVAVTPLGINNKEKYESQIQEKKIVSLVALGIMRISVAKQGTNNASGFNIIFTCLGK